MNDNTTMVPTVAKVVFENDAQVQQAAAAISSDLDPVPINLTDSTGATIDLCTVDSEFDHNQDPDNPIYGEVLTGDEMENEKLVNDPVLNALKAESCFVPTQWMPNLNTIVEETSYALELNDQNLSMKPSLPTSGKKQRRIAKLQKSIDATIAKAISNNSIYRVRILTAQHDGGANRSVTSQKNLLLHYTDINDYAINGVKDGEAAITCTGMGYLPWRANSGEIILVRCLFCPEASGTILSPSDINAQYSDRYSGWTMVTNYDSKLGTFQLEARDGVNHLQFSSYSENNLWFHYLDQVTNDEYSKIGTRTSAIVKKLSTGAAYELWHNRLGHPGKNIMKTIHKHVIGVPHLKANKFYSCAACMSSKLRKTHIGPTKMTRKEATPKDECESGQHLHADFGFVRGSDWSKKDNDGKLVTSIDGYRSYCLVIDRATRYIWIILTKTKSPPIVELRDLLTKLQSKVKSQYKTITTDLGGELAKANSFRNMLMEKGVEYTLKTTGAYSSAQNGLAEKPNQDLARTMRCMLYGAGLSSKYWSYALRHAVYLKNRLPHTSLQFTTPFEKLMGVKPDLSKLRVFGARTHFIHKSRGKKLDRIDGTGTFLTYKGTDKICYVIDSISGKERVVTHASFDEAYASMPLSKQPPMAKALQQSGYRHDLEKEAPVVKVRLLDPSAQLPVRGTKFAAGFDMHSNQSIIIPKGQQAKISTKVALDIPPGYHGQLYIRSSYALKYRARLEAGTIDSDYRGEVFILISNNGDDALTISKGDRIAQLIIVQDPSVQLSQVSDLNTTARGDKGFGSTGIKEIQAQQSTPSPIPITSKDLTSTTASAATLHDNDHIPICNVDISHDPFLDRQTVTMTTRGFHATQGMILEPHPEWSHHVIIKSCKPGTAATKILNWRKRLKNSILLDINGTAIQSVEQATAIMSKLQRGVEITLTVGLSEKLPMHDSNGTPMMYFDQLNAIATHLDHIKYGNHHQTINKESQNSNYVLQKVIKVIRDSSNNSVSKLQGILPKSKIRSRKLTRKKLKAMDNWNDWKQAEWQQLDQYYGQKMFGEPCPLPPGANVLSLLWCYDVKSDGRLKARMVCNGRPSNKNTVIFGYTYAKSLDHVGSRVFWAAAAAKNFIVRGADASNAFAEAEAPKIPLYVRLNDQYREWWVEKMKRKPIPTNFVLPVHKALQGHPEAPRAWATLIDTILQTKLNLKPTTHEPCLYHGTFNDQEVLFLRQVDDFAVASANESTAMSVIKEIDKYMSIDIKDLGQLERYNGVDIIQTKYYIKLNNPTYLKKIINEHAWMLDTPPPLHNLPLPMHDEKNYITQLEQAESPSTIAEQQKLQLQMNFNYRQAVGELIYAMVTCRPDISFPLIKLSQYSANPAKIHYEAIIQIFKYLNATIDDGLVYWRKSPHPDLPHLPFPTVHKSNYTPEYHTNVDSSDTLHGAVDSDWAGDTKHRKSVSGIVLRLAGGTLLYKTKYQDTISLSTTEAEFTAACDAGKAILYVRSILDEINLPQDQATTLFIDNNGALMMGNAQQPTRRTRHMELKKFALLDWVKHDLIIMRRISTKDNCADGLTKQTGRTLFYRHFDYILGKHIPDYVKCIVEKYNQMATVNTMVNNSSPLMELYTSHFNDIVLNLCSNEHGGDVTYTK